MFYMFIVHIEELFLVILIPSCSPFAFHHVPYRIVTNSIFNPVYNSTQNGPQVKCATLASRQKEFEDFLLPNII